MFQNIAYIIGSTGSFPGGPLDNSGKLTVLPMAIPTMPDDIERRRAESRTAQAQFNPWH